jgi:hypothetical protein
MKKYYHVLIVFVMIVVLSCDNNQETSQTLPQGIPEFNSSQEFSLATGVVASSSEEELDAWETKKGFISMRTILNRAKLEASLANSYEEFLVVAKKFSDVAFVEDSTLVPFIGISFYQSIVNREGFYKTGDFIHKVIGNYIITTHVNDFSKLDGLSQQTDPNSLKSIEAIKSFKYFGTDSDDNGRTAAACSSYQEASYFANASKCRDDREVYVSGKSYMTMWTGFEGDWYQPRVELKVWGRIRNGWCNWNDYDTELSYRNASFDIMAWSYQGGVLSTKLEHRVISDYAPSGDRRNLRWDTAMGDPVLNVSLPTNSFINLHFEGASRGTNNNYAVLDCR